ncbi:hypothetical protein N7452_002107 [Penicillium brevicompactum]|uniref:RanBD1 domain-containing protein n=1 Tax=Penicillium brevicompactum TaxID=5074 RepID=A0A9W9R3Q5_PENBR|nr:hypothetical protein N7452_002107 [Penicillium brevicompactum]
MSFFAREQSPSAVAAQSPPSDNDGGERPVRQQLQNTNIDSVNGPSQINRKRSLEDADAATDEHPTKRSREGTPESSSQPAPAGENSAAPKEQGANVSDDEFDDYSDFCSEAGFEPPKAPMESGAQSPTLPTSSGSESWNTDGDTICEPAPLKFSIPLEIDIAVTIGGAREIRHFALPLEISIPAGAKVESAVAVPGKPKSHISISSDGSVASPPVARKWAERAPDTPGPILHDPLYSRRVLPRASDFFGDPVHPSVQSDTHAPGVADYLSDSDQVTQQKPNDSDVKEQDKISEPAKDESAKEQESNNSAFSASAFGKASAGSPFGLTNANASASPFAVNNSSSTASPFGSSKPASTPSSFENSAFNSTSAASPFATGGTSSFGGFGGLKSGSSFAASPFANPLGGKTGKVTSFASPDVPTPLGDSKSKQLGATTAENEDSENESEAEPNDTFVAEKTDERFHAKTGMTPWIPPFGPAALNNRSLDQVETGEENETTKFAAKGKLYYFDEQWKERGAGTFKVNTKTDADGNISGRMIMRADGALRVTLNSAIFHDMNHGDTSGKRPTSKDIFLATKEDGKVGLLLLRLGNVDQSTELYDVLEDILKDFPQTAKK